MLQAFKYVPKDLRNVPITMDHHYPQLCGDRNTKSNGVTLEAPLHLRVKFQLGDKIAEKIIDQLESCEFNLKYVPKHAPQNVHLSDVQFQWYFLKTELPPLGLFCSDSEEINQLCVEPTGT